MTKTTKTDKTGAIKTIDKSVLKAGTNNKLNLKQTYLIDDILKNAGRDKKKTNAQMYKDNIARDKNQSTDVASTEFNSTLKKPKIQKALQEVLIDNNIDKDSILKTELNIINKAYNINQLNTALNGNHKLMELEGMTQLQPNTQINIQVNKINKMSDNEINDRLKDIITL